jgi:hypothetical protein
MQVFLEFLRQSRLAIDGEAEGRSPPEPDILCKHREHGFIAFELVERNRSHPQAFQAAGFAGIMGSVRLARAAAMRLQA